MAAFRSSTAVVAAAAEIDASERFDKEGLVKAHERHRSSVMSMMDMLNGAGADDSLTQIVMSTAVDQPSEDSNNPPVPPLRNLKPVFLRRLRPGRRHSGQVLHGRLCVEPVILIALQTVIEDEAGRAAKLSIYNALPSSASMQDACTMFPKGMAIAIKEPYLKRAKDGCLMIRVDNLVTIVEGSAAAAAASLMHMSTCNAKLRNTSEQHIILESRELRSKGNEAFQARNWMISVQLYTEALLFLLQEYVGKGRSASPASLSPAIRQELVLVLSNRAEARLRLRHFEKAERDAFKALCLEPEHVKSLYRRGKALHGLHLYEEAALSFKKALDFTGKLQSSSSMIGIKQELVQSLEESRVCHKQATTGEYDFARICRDEQHGREPICAEYIGPVVVGCAMDKTLGRGLLVTKDVERGELLLVTRAVADSGTIHIKEDTSRQDIAIQLMQLAMASERFKEQIHSLAYGSSSSVVANLHIPDMDLFRPCLLPNTTDDPLFTDDEEVSPGDAGCNVDLDRIRGVARTNSFYNPFGIKRPQATIWLLPSFINHSCMPTACCILVSDRILFIRAASNLQKGQEVTIPYCMTLIPSAPLLCSVRALYYQNIRGFRCSCQRCVFERSVQASTKQLEASLLDPLFDSKELVESLEWVMEHAGVIREEKQKQWLRTSFACAYVRMLENIVGGPQEIQINAWVREMVRGVQATLGGVEGMVMLLASKGWCRIRAGVRQPVSVRRMCETLYGKQSPAVLFQILDARSKLRLLPAEII